MTVKIIHYRIDSDIVDQMGFPSDVILEQVDDFGVLVDKLNKSKYSTLILDGRETYLGPTAFEKIRDAVVETGQGNIIGIYLPKPPEELPAYGALIMRLAKEV